MTRIVNITRQSDFRRNPIKAVYRRLYWRLRWGLSDKLWVLHLRSGPLIAVSRNMGATLYYWGGEYEEETMAFIQRFLKDGMVFLDIGAHMGVYTLTAAHAVGKDGEVHAFEPVPQAYNLLQRSISLNMVDNAYVNQIAVSDRDEEVEFHINSKDPSVSGIKMRKDKLNDSDILLTRVPCTTLDTYCAKHARKIDLIKIDVEGAELKVLSGARHLLTQTADQSPVLVFELSAKNYETFGYSVSDLVAFLDDCGYSLFRFSGSGLSPILTVDSSLLNGFSNVVAVKGNGVMHRHVMEASTDV
jgi:FkbM family methyltransferase